MKYFHAIFILIVVFLPTKFTKRRKLTNLWWFTVLQCFFVFPWQSCRIWNYIFLTFLFSVYFQIMFWHLYFQTVIWIILYGILFEAQMNTLFQNIKHSFALKGSKTHLGNWIWLSIKTLWNWGLKSFMFYANVNDFIFISTQPDVFFNSSVLNIFIKII